MNSFSLQALPYQNSTFEYTTSDQGELEELVQQLIHHMRYDPKSSSKGNAEPQVLFVVTLDGFRYVLACVPALTSPLEVTLSPREQEITRLVAKGFPNKSIALVLDISPYTVATYLRRVFVKLGVNSRAEMVARLWNDL
jgi:DNA-binding CsgD family transcriptional regulator